LNIEKLAIGTANFGLDYGISNSKGKIENSELLRIIRLAKESGVSYVDTAQAYGNAELRIGMELKDDISSFNIISKLEPGFNDSIYTLVNRTLKNVGQNGIYGFIYHDFKDFLNNKDSFNELMSIREKGIIKKIGFSLYYPWELELLFEEEIDFDIVQFPYNIFDRRFEYLFDKLKTKSIEIHVRSVFLQGLVFLNPNNLPSSFNEISSKLNELKELSKGFNISVAALCLNYAICNSYIDQVVIGVDSSKQLEQNVNDVNNSVLDQIIMNKLNSFSIINEQIILPKNWKL